MLQRWCNSANLRRNQIESGLDLTFNEIFKPAFINQIAALKPKSILEVGAGTGHLSKELSQFNYKITAIEPSYGMFTVAGDVLSGCQVSLINCALRDLPLSQKYNLVFSNLVAHVVDDLPSFLSLIAIHLDKGGHFLFSIPHPCFYNEYKKLFGAEYSYMEHMAKNVSFHISLDNKNEITNVPYFHRPLSTYINSLIRAGFSVDNFEEIYPDKVTQIKYGSLWKTPRYCIFTCKKFL